MLRLLSATCIAGLSLYVLARSTLAELFGLRRVRQYLLYRRALRAQQRYLSILRRVHCPSVVNK